jgi:hypothetical protein
MAKKPAQNPVTQTATASQAPKGNGPKFEPPMWAAGVGAGITAVTVATVYTVGSAEIAAQTFDFAFKSVLVLGVLGTAAVIGMFLKK